MTTASLENNQLSNNSIHHFKSDLIKVDDNLFNCSLTLSDGETMNIHMRNDGYINATLLCKAGGKEFNNLISLKYTYLSYNTFYDAIDIFIL